MGARPDVHSRDELAGERKGAMALDRAREAASMAIATREAGWSLEQLSDDEFEQLLELDRKREERVKRLITNRLQEGVHYGTVPGISKPFAWEPTADEILKLFRWDCRPISEPVVHRGTDYVEATVTVAIFDLAGRQIGAAAMRSCGTLEKRFRNKSSGKWKFDDPREAVNECVSMAFKRGKVAATLGAAGAKPFFAKPELLEPGEAEDAVRAEPEPATPEELGQLYAAARKADIKNAEGFKAFVQRALGRGFIGTGANVARLLTELDAKQAASVPPVKNATKDYGEDPPQAAAAPARSPEDEAIDLALAGQGEASA